MLVVTNGNKKKYKGGVKMTKEISLQEIKKGKMKKNKNYFILIESGADWNNFLKICLVYPKRSLFTKGLLHWKNRKNFFYSIPSMKLNAQEKKEYEAIKKVLKKKNFKEKREV